MSQVLVVGVLIGGLMATLLAFAPQISGWLVRAAARRLSETLSPRMEEEWLAELAATPSRPSQLAFAIALVLTRRHSFSVDDDMLTSSSRSSFSAATVGGWPSVVIASTLTFAAIAYSASFLIPPMYRSTARVLMAPSRMPEAFLEPTVLGWQDRLRGTTARVLSQATLERIILGDHLYQVSGDADGATPVSAALVERMRRDIDVQLLPDRQSFEISYQSRDPRLAQKGASRLVSLYIQTNMTDRSTHAEASSESLEAQINDVRARLLKQSAEIRSAVDLGVPEVEIQRIEHEHLKSVYRELLMKREQTLMWNNLERRQIGEQFKLIEVAQRPDVPFSPDRRLIAGEGAAAGFLLGVVMMLAGPNGPFRRVKRAAARS